jgi:protein SOK2
MSQDRLPALSLPPPGQAFSSSSSSPRVSSISSNSSYAGSLSSYTSVASSNGPKTPSPHFPHHVVTGIPTTIAAYDAMNQTAQEMYYQPMSAGQPHNPQTVTSSAMPHYSQQPPLLHPGPAQYSPAQSPYGHYGYGAGIPSHGNGLTSPSTGQPPVSGQMGGPQSVLPLPGVPGQQNGMQPGYAGFDTTGQHPPPGMKPRVTATLWEDEGSLCFQVEARGVCVARRQDNHMINGTKLLNVAGMTRGRRDGILKSEKTRHVVKIGPMHLKGVWIPYERALEFANKEKITEMLYPLFVQNIGSLLYHPTNQSRTAQVMTATVERRGNKEPGQLRTPQPPGLPSMPQPQQPLALPGPQTPLPSQNNISRPPLDRANTFPTPPASASGVMPSMGNHEGYGWQGQGMNGHQAATPPGPMHSMQSYPPTTQAYESSRQMYAPSSHQSPYQTSASTPNDRMYSHAGSYGKTDMAPPSNRGPAHGANGDHDTKPPNGILPSEQTSEPPHAGEQEGEHDHEPEYAHDNGSYDAGRSSYSYTAPGVGSLTNDSNISPDMTGSPGHPGGSGRATPRTTQPNPYYSQHPGYSTPPRVQQSTSNLYSVMSSDRPTTNGAPSGDVYAPSADMSNGYATQPPSMNGAGMKRGREDEEDLSRTGADGSVMGNMDLKRRKTLMDSAVPAPAYDSMIRPTSAVGGARRR